MPSTVSYRFELHARLLPTYRIKAPLTYVNGLRTGAV